MPPIAARLVRYADLVPCLNAFVDTRSPGSDAKENFTIIGPGVGENPGQHVHIREKHGFNVSAARQPAGCLNSQHSHDHAEVFVVHSGRWRLLFGVEAGADGHLDIGPGDVASVPIHMFRGFAKLDEGLGFLWVPLGQDDPGKVVWAPKVYELAKDYGLVLLEGGTLIDTTIGEVVPEGARPDPGPTAEQIAKLVTPPPERMATIVARFDALCPNPQSPLAAEGISEAAIIGTDETGDGFGPGPICGWWPHGFVLRLLRIASGRSVPAHVRAEAEVLFVHEGALEVSVGDETLVMVAGDTFSTPQGIPRSFRSMSSGEAVVFVLRGGDRPTMPKFLGIAR